MTHHKRTPAQVGKANQRLGASTEKLVRLALGTATLTKTFPEIVIQKRLRDGSVKGFIKSKGTTDYVGFFKVEDSHPCPLRIEVKSCKGKSFGYDKLKVHQHQKLLELTIAGGVSLLAIQFNEGLVFYRYPIEGWRKSKPLKFDNPAKLVKGWQLNDLI